MSWIKHLYTGDKALAPTIRKKIGALRILKSSLSFRSRLLLANGFIMSTLSATSPLWSGESTIYLRKLQQCQSFAAWLVCGVNRGTHIKTETVLKTCGWMSVRHLSTYQSLVWLYKLQQDQMAMAKYCEVKLIT